MRVLLCGMLLLGLCLSGFTALAPYEAKAQQIILPCVPSGTSCIPVSAANPLPTTGGGSTFPPAGCSTANGVIFNNAAPCDTGFTYAGAGGNIAFTGSMSGPATGSASATTYNFGTAGTGFFGTATTISIGIATANLAFFAATGLTINNGSIALPAASNINWAGGSFLFSPSNAVFRFGGNPAASPIAQTLGVQNVSAGTSNIGGANLTINGSQSTGTGVGGKIILQTSLTGTTGTTVNSNFPMITINPGGTTTATVQFGDGTNFTTYDSCTTLTTGATGIMACTASAIRFKELFSPRALNLAGLDVLRTDIPWKYLDDVGYGLDTKRVHVGLFADDVEKLDPRCVVYRNDGQLGDYEDRCVIAYLVADRKQLKAEIEALRQRIEK